MACCYTLQPSIDSHQLLLPNSRVTQFRFTIHECGGAETLVDVDRTLVSYEDVREAAIEIARSTMAKEIVHGRLCLSCWIVVANEYGHNILTLHFGDAVQQVEHEPPPLV